MARKGNSNTTTLPRRIKFIIPIILITVTFTCFYVCGLFNIPRIFPIRHVHVYGINHVNPKAVQEALQPLVKQGFFATKIALIRNRLREFSWVSDILVRRNWPDLVDVTIVEKNAIALWRNTALLSDGGDIFTPDIATWPSGLPVFNGPSGKQMVMLEHFNNINRILAPLHAKIAYLELTPYEAWKLTLDNGITLQMGQKDVLTRLEHFVKVYGKIVGDRAQDVDYIDLRYSNGVAVKRKTAV